MLMGTKICDTSFNENIRNRGTVPLFLTVRFIWKNVCIM